MIKYKYNGVLYDTFKEVKPLFPNVSFPTKLTQDLLEPFGITQVTIEDVIPEPVIYIPTQEDIINGYTQAVQEHLDTTAQARGYDNILSLCTYATSVVPKFKLEGQAGVEWRDSVWAKCYEILAAVQAGTREAPTDIISELPVMNWGASE